MVQPWEGPERSRARSSVSEGVRESERASHTYTNAHTHRGTEGVGGRKTEREREEEEKVKREKEREKGETPDQVIESQQTSKGLSGLCEREQRSNHGARALPGTLCHAGSHIPPGMRRGFLPRPERHGAHRAGREVSGSV